MLILGRVGLHLFYALAKTYFPTHVLCLYGFLNFALKMPCFNGSRYVLTSRSWLKKVGLDEIEFNRVPDGFWCLVFNAKLLCRVFLL